VSLAETELTFKTNPHWGHLTVVGISSVLHAGFQSLSKRAGSLSAEIKSLAKEHSAIDSKPKYSLTRVRFNM
jgi:hypothetical protein